MAQPSVYMEGFHPRFVPLTQYEPFHAHKKFLMKVPSAVCSLFHLLFQRLISQLKDLMWSDPDDIENWAVSPRGAGWLFGGTVVNEVIIHSLSHFSDILIMLASKFNHVNSLKLIARAHQLVQEGFKYMFDKQLVTVWSAPNYCYRCGNKASIMTVHEDGSNSFSVYDAAPENERDKGQFKRLVSFFLLLLLAAH